MRRRDVGSGDHQGNHIAQKRAGMKNLVRAEHQGRDKQILQREASARQNSRFSDTILSPVRRFHFGRASDLDPGQHAHC
jgi:hypothetical protein